MNWFFSTRFDLQTLCKDTGARQALHQTKLCVRGSFVIKKLFKLQEGAVSCPASQVRSTVAQQVCRGPVWQRTSCKLFTPSVKPVERAREPFCFKAHSGRTIQHHRDCLWKRFSKQLKCFLYFTVNPFWELFLDKVCYKDWAVLVKVPAITTVTDVWARSFAIDPSSEPVS